MLSWADLARGKKTVDATVVEEALKNSTVCNTSPKPSPNPSEPLAYHSNHNHHHHLPLSDAALTRETSPVDESFFSDNDVVDVRLVEGHAGRLGLVRRPTKRGEGMITAYVGRLSADVWAAILSYCTYETVLKTGASCVFLRSLSQSKELWSHLTQSHVLQHELFVGHSAPSLEFMFPVDMSSVATCSRRDDAAARINGAVAAVGVGRGTTVDERNEPVAEFVRFSRYLARSETRLWHLKEFIGCYAPVVETGAVRMSYVATHDDGFAPAGAAVPITITWAERRGPFLKPSDISTVFSHQAANAMAACRILTQDITASYTRGFLERLGRSLATPSLHKGLGRVLVSATLIEISLQEALRCLEVYTGARARSVDDGMLYTSLLTSLLEDITIEECETRYFAIRQLSTEAHIGIVFVDPILTLLIAAGSGQAHAY